MSQQLLVNPNFSDDTTGWSASGGFGTYSHYTSNQIAVLDGVAYFTYVSRTLSQVVNVSSVVAASGSLVAVVNIRHRQKGDDGGYSQIDTYNFEVVFKNSSGAILATRRTPAAGDTNAPKDFTDVGLTLNRSDLPSDFDSISTVEVKITGIDTGFWNGNHGPMVDYVTLTAYEPSSSSSESSSTPESSSSSSESSSTPERPKNKWLGKGQSGHFSLTKGLMKRLWPDFSKQSRQRF